MAMARYKDLCIDATDAHRLGRFWGALLGLRLADHEDGDAQLEGQAPEERIWVNVVPEPKTVKHRVHLDVHVRDVAPLEALGASVLRPGDDEIDWTVMTDVEGGEFCAFLRDDPPRHRLLALVVDAMDARSQASWWQEALGGRMVRHRDGWWSVAGIPGAPFPQMLFIDVPGPKVVKNRIHWDVESEDRDALFRHGARLLRQPDDDIRWNVLADREGNEFCVFEPS